MSAYGFVYIWRDRKRNWYYIGSHVGDENDGYKGSGCGHYQNAMRFRSSDFKRRILERIYVTDGVILKQREQYWLDMIKDDELHTTENRKNGTTRYYNVKRKATGIDSMTASRVARKMLDMGNCPFFREDVKQKAKLGRERSSKKHNGVNAMHNVCRNGRWWNNGVSQTRSLDQPGPTWVLGRIDCGFTPESNKARGLKVSNSMKGKAKSAIHREKLREANLGKKWWNDGKTSTQSLNKPGDEWVLGRMPFSRGR